MNGFMRATTGTSNATRRPSVASMRTLSPTPTPSLPASPSESVTPSARGCTGRSSSPMMRLSQAPSGTPISASRWRRGPADRITSAVRSGSTASTPGSRASSRSTRSCWRSAKVTLTSMRCATPKLMLMIRSTTAGKLSDRMSNASAKAMPATVVAERRGKRTIRRTSMRARASSRRAARSTPAPRRPKCVGAGGDRAVAGGSDTARATATAAPSTAASSATPSAPSQVAQPASNSSTGSR